MTQEESSATETTASDNKFAKYAEDDSALTEASKASSPTSTTDAASGQLSLFGKVLIFLGFPTVVGFIGLYIGFLETRKKEATRDLSFDQDFALPFALGLAMCVVIGFQTRGFSKSQPTPLLLWPKVKKRRRIVHKHVVKGQEEKEEEGGDDEEEKEAEDKADDDKKND